MLTIFSGIQFASSVIHKHFWKTLILHHKQVTLIKQCSGNKEPKGSRSSASSKPMHPRCSSAQGWGGSLGNRSSLLALALLFTAPARHARRLRVAKCWKKGGLKLSRSPRKARSVFALVKALSKVKREKCHLILPNFILSIVDSQRLFTDNTVGYLCKNTLP